MARSGFLLAVISVVVGGGMASCSVLVDSSGLSSGAGVSNEGGASSSSSSSSSSSGSSSSSSSSGSPGGGDAGDAGPSSLCEQPNRFCSTFDNLTTTDALNLQLLRGTGKLTTQFAVSAPNGLEFETATLQNEKGNASLDLRLGPSVATLHFEHDFRLLEAPPDTGYVETSFVRIDTGPSQYRCWLFVMLHTGAWRHAEGCNGAPSQEGEIGVPIELNKWIHVSWDVRADHTGTFQFGDKIFQFSLPSPGLVGGQLRVHAGIYYAQEGSNRTRMAIDNVLVRD